MAEYIVGCVTCGGSYMDFPPDVSPIERATQLVRAGWRRVVGGWRCPSCVEEEEADAA